jgi:hypothetical protein
MMRDAHEIDLDIHHQKEDARRVNLIMRDVSDNICEVYDLLKEARDYIDLAPEDMDISGQARGIVKRIDKLLPIISNICDRI